VSKSDEYQVVIVKYGTRTTTKSDVYLNHHIYGQPDESLDMDYFFWVVRNEHRTIVVDTGFSADGGAKRNRTPLIAPAAALTALDIDPTEPLPVVVTHAHYDHIGNLNLFESSEVFISSAEYKFWTGRHAIRAQFHYSVEDAELSELASVGRQGRLRTFDDAVLVAPGIEAIRVGGHTPGQSIVKVNTGDGVVLLASDAIHYQEEYEADMPFAFVAGLVEMYEGFDRIHAMENTGEVRHVVAGHDPGTLARFTPLGGDLAGLAATIG
jgi:glyoxylase-like metal-dependent hydrolase (beta-lactamase superfamily II)